MAYHAKNSLNFVGLRTDTGGRRQIVCVANNGQRVLLDICDPTTPDAIIDEALEEGVNARNVVSGVMCALKARNIPVDLVK